MLHSFNVMRTCKTIFNCQVNTYLLPLDNKLFKILTNILYYHLLLCSDASSLPPPLSDNAKGFLVTLEHSSEEELSLHLQDRMQFSKEAIACLVCVFDRLHSRIDSMCKQVQAAGNCGNKLINDRSYVIISN